MTAVETDTRNKKEMTGWNRMVDLTYLFLSHIPRNRGSGFVSKKYDQLSSLCIGCTDMIYVGKFSGNN